MDTPYTSPHTSTPPYRTDVTGTLRLSEVVAALTYALDITEGQPEDHALRSCLIGMAAGAELGLDPQTLPDLYYALLLKDLGRSSVLSRRPKLCRCSRPLPRLQRLL